MNTTNRLRWGIIGTGAIAGAFAEGLSLCNHGTLVAVGSRSKESAEKFGEKWNVPATGRHASYEALLADKNVEAVYIATPHPMHAEWTIKAAEAKKHILVEKPIGLNFYEATAMIEAAIANDVFLMEAFMYRCDPQTAKLIELLRDKAIGDVRVVHGSFSFKGPDDENRRILSNDLAGGGILDVGCYPVSMSRLIAGVVDGKDFLDPIEVKGSAHLGRTNVDEWAIGSLKFANGILAQVSTGVQVNQENALRIFGTEGNIYVPTPWVPARNGGSSKIIVTKKGEKEPQEITIDSPMFIYGIEADVVAENVRAGRKQAPAPAMTWDDTLGNIKTLDAWRASCGLVYNAEKKENAKTVTVANRPLKKKPDHNMKYGRIAGLDERHVAPGDGRGQSSHLAARVNHVRRLLRARRQRV